MWMMWALDDWNQWSTNGQPINGQPANGLNGWIGERVDGWTGFVLEAPHWVTGTVSCEFSLTWSLWYCGCPSVVPSLIWDCSRSFLVCSMTVLLMSSFPWCYLFRYVCLLNPVCSDVSLIHSWFFFSWSSSGIKINITGFPHRGFPSSFSYSCDVFLIDDWS